MYILLIVDQMYAGIFVLGDEVATERDFYFDIMLSTTTTVVEIKHYVGVRCPGMSCHRDAPKKLKNRGNPGVSGRIPN